MTEHSNLFASDDTATAKFFSLLCSLITFLFTAFVVVILCAIVVVVTMAIVARVLVSLGVIR